MSLFVPLLEFDRRNRRRFATLTRDKPVNEPNSVRSLPARTASWASIKAQRVNFSKGLSATLAHTLKRAGIQRDRIVDLLGRRNLSLWVGFEEKLLLHIFWKRPVLKARATANQAGGQERVAAKRNKWIPSLLRGRRPFTPVLEDS
jgi:hypothetical protein